MTERRNFSSGAPWEATIGYSRAVRVGPLVEVAGTVAVDAAGQVVAPADPYGQAAFILEKIEKVLRQAGCSRSDVVRTRIYLVDVADWQEVGRAHGEFFRGINPASTMLAVKALIGQEYRVEIECTAVLGEHAPLA